MPVEVPEDVGFLEGPVVHLRRPGVPCPEYVGHEDPEGRPETASEERREYKRWEQPTPTEERG